MFPDGTPLTTGGVVLFQAVAGDGRAAAARGAIRENGMFEMTTSSPGDGAVPGKHRVLVRAQRDQDDYIKRGIIPRPVIDPRFESYQTSRLEVNVKKASNEVTLVVERPK